MKFLLQIVLCLLSYPGVIHTGSMTGYVVGGVEVPISMYPIVAHITRFGSHHCGGAIVSDRVIVTAAHCIDEHVDISSLDVYLGQQVYKEGDKYSVCKAIIHDKYSDENFMYDVGLILLEKKIVFGPLVQKAKFAPNRSWRHSKCKITVAGFGITMTEGNPSNKLKAVRMRYIDSETCSKSQSYGKKPLPVPKQMFCMIGEKWSSDCYGDSGSAVMWKRYLIGIVSTGRDSYCGSDVMPSMYIDIGNFKKWIKRNVHVLESVFENECQSLEKKNRRK